MKKIYYFLLPLFGVLLMTSCLKDDNEYVDYEAWRLENEAYFNRMKDSIDPKTEKPYYTEIQSQAYPAYSILYHEIEPGKEDGRIPFYTSTVKTDYNGHIINSTTDFDKGTNSVFKVNGLIQGWQIALQRMPEGAKWELIIPWQLAYGAAGSGQSIPPFSTLIFNMKLVEITQWETGSNGSDSK